MDHPSKRITYCFMISLIACSIATIVITCVNFAHINGDSYDFVDIANNWQTGAIMDVTVSSYCPQGYQEAFNYTWPGTVAGCWCGDASFFWKSYYDIYYDMSVGSCSWNETKAGCYNINSEPSVNLDVWGQYNGTNMKVCVQRSQETWLQVANQSGPGCNNNTALKQCGFSPDNIFCTAGTQCPINSVKFVNLTLPVQNAQLLNCTPANNCTIVAQNPTSAKVFYYTRGDAFDALPTSQMRLNEYSMCDDSTENDITPGRTDFKLMAHTRSTCYSEGASMWNLTDSMTETQLFNLNGLTNTINYLDHFGYYSDGEDGSDYIYSVFSRSYIPWSISCRGSMSGVVNNASSISKLRVVQLVLMIFTILSGLALGIALPILLQRMLNDDSSSLRKTALTVNYVAKIPTLGLQIAVLIISKNTKGFFFDIIDDNCSTAEVTQTLSSLADHLQQNYVCNAINIGFQVLLFFIGIGYFHRPNNMYQQDYTDSAKPFYDPQAPEQRPNQDFQVVTDDQTAAQYGYNQTQAPTYFQGALEDQPPQANQYGGDNFYAPPATNQFNNNQPYGY